MAEILEGKYVDSVRGEIGVSVDELPDSEINDAMVLDYTEAAMIALLPGWESLSESQLTAFQRATMLKLCLALLPRLRLKVTMEESDGKTSQSRFRFMEWGALEQQLLGGYAEAISLIQSLAPSSRNLLTTVAPATDPITG